MEQRVRVGIIGDFDQKKQSHPATNGALQHAGSHLNAVIEIVWLPTPSFNEQNELKKLSGFVCLWVNRVLPKSGFEVKRLLTAESWQC